MNATERDPHGGAHLQASRSWAGRPRAVESLTDDDLSTGAYPNEWSTADVHPHLGSSTVITH